MTEQLELVPAKAPKVSCDEVHALLGILTYQGWMTASQVAAMASMHWGMTWSERKVRAVANASCGQVISGQDGYKLTLQATIEEIQQASGWLRSQADAMRQRSIEIERVYHRKLRSNGTTSAAATNPG